ncbi:hypothetical protein [Saccharothrix sp. HUAS TT1]|uniref:hypothetical protein n=1 Tax=unclassified Saccharothrix TaxID=2593673 RepID=UPI00345C318B
MRRALVLVAPARASTILVAVLVPLAIVTREVAHRTALADAERSVTVVVGVLAGADGRDAITTGLAEVVAVSGHAVAVRTPAGPVGFPRATRPQVPSARGGPPVDPAPAASGRGPVAPAASDAEVAPSIPTAPPAPNRSPPATTAGVVVRR